MKYAEYLHSAEWRAKANAVLARDHGKCRRCDSAATEVHHLTYERVFCEALDDLISLCRACHKLDHGRAGFEEGEMQKAAQVRVTDRKLRNTYR